MKREEIYLGQFPQGGRGGRKLRPVLLLTDPVGDVPEFVAGYISSVIPPILLDSDFVLDPTKPEHAVTRLKAKSIVRLHKLATVHARDLVRRLGVLPPSLSPIIEQKLRTLLSL